MSGKDFWQTQDIERLGIPSMFLADGPHGVRRQGVAADHLGLNPSLPATCFPTAATVANSWDEELGEGVGACIGEEAAAQGVSVLLGPGTNMKRNPLCGRNFEYFSEDPYLAGKLAAAYVRGIQSNGVAACLKHFCANNQEQSRMTIDTVVDERTLREIYLTAFEIAVKEGKTRTIMSAYNRVNGEYANENQHLLREILRQEWGFDGCVITDWGGSNDRVTGLLAGNELEMPTTGGETDREIVEAVRSGKLDESVLDECVDRLLCLVLDTAAALKEKPATADATERHAFARRAAEESIVLLKNEDGLLPLKPETSVAIIGDFAAAPRYQGAGSSIVNPTSLECAADLASGASFRFAGYESGFNRYGKTSRRLARRAVSLAKSADVVLLYLGLDEFTEVEGLERKGMALPKNQLELIDAIAAANANVVVVLSCGSAIEMPWIGKVKAVLHGYLGGQAGASAMLRAITGAINPSGKLAETYPLRYADTPSFNFFPGKEASVEYREGPFIGYRYFDTASVPVLFPFGYGLSYTRFEYSNLSVDTEGVTFSLRNVGRVAGAEVAQLYVGCASSSVFRPRKELKGFAKVRLEPGEERRVRIAFDDKAFRYFNVATNRWETEGAEYSIMVGASVADIRLNGSLTIAGTGAPSPYETLSLNSYATGQVQGVGLAEFERLLGRQVPRSRWDRSKPLGYNDTVAQCQYAKGAFARFAFHVIVFAHWFLRKIGRRGEANMIMMSVYYMPFRGIARMTGGMVSAPMVDGLLTIVNGHFFRGMARVIREYNTMRRSAK